MAKRAFDVFFAVIGLLFLSPLLLLLAIAVKLGSRGPVLFRQQRIGKNGRPFSIVKFRSMMVNAENVGLSVTCHGDRRVNTIGRYFRKYKLDELPQLWNVLVGEMSFVGPRPEVPRYVRNYTTAQKQVLTLKPGITDPATLEFRNEETLLATATDTEKFYREYCVPRKIELNLAYVSTANIWEDVKIILQTVFPFAAKSRSEDGSREPEASGRK